MRSRIKRENGFFCTDCKHYDPLRELEFNESDSIKSIDEDVLCCIAFPYGIPDDIYDNAHDKPRPDLGQKNDIVFTKGEG
ncbi:MAG TPA: hypothetical protein PKJ08_04945 [Candidatus Cloacimonadota bacterium]|jgi:hypothetical protein|nr:hypothetical protein [Candidatus Cloacimonadota bacterium]HPO60959.1 hypothetical protein [Exilispira sp.]